jgi:hypothetical protein
LQDLEQKSLLHHPQGPVSGQVTNIVFMFSQDALFGTTLTKYILPSKVQYARKIMFIYQFALFRQAKTEIIKVSTNFEKSVGKFNYGKPLYMQNDYLFSGGGLASPC